MKNYKTIVLVLSILFLILAAGCKNSSDNSLPVQETENLKQEEKIEYVDKDDTQVEEIEFGDITDPIELEKLWQEYFYDSIATIGNTREFNSAQEIDPLNVAEFCWFKYIAEHGKESLELVSKDSTLRLFPLDIVLRYANHYFNLDDLDVTKIEDNYFDSKKQAFMFNMGSERSRPSYTENNAWGIHLDTVTRNNDGSITAVMVNYDTYQSRRVESTRTFILKERQDGSLYFIAGRWDYVNNHLVHLSGDYQRFDKIQGFDGYIGELTMLGEDNNRLIMAKMSYDKRKDAALLLVNLDTMQVEKRLNLDTNLGFSDVNMSGEKIVVRFKDRIIIFAKTLEQWQEIPLPEVVKDKIEREPKFDKDGFPDIYFGGYDISKDLNRIVYADEIGVKLFNITDNSEILLSPTVPIEGSELLNSSFHSNPRLIDDDQKVITTMTGYESTRGYTLCNLEDGSTKTYGISSEGSSTGLIRYDTGLLEVDAYLSKILYLDFKTGMVKEIEIEDAGDTGYIRPSEYCYIGQDYAAFIIERYDRSDNTKSMYYLNRLNLKTFKVDPKIVSVTATPIQILGVLADGRILFSYNLNPSESGVCITNAAGQLETGESTVQSKEIQALRGEYFDFGMANRLDYIPMFKEGEAPSNSAEYLFYAFAINLDNWGDDKGTMTRGYVEQVIRTHFEVENINHSSLRKGWDYDGEKYTAVPQGIKEKPIYVLQKFKTQKQNGRTVYDITLDYCSSGVITTDEDMANIRANIVSGDLSMLTVLQTERFQYYLDELTGEVVFLSHTLEQE